MTDDSTAPDGADEFTVDDFLGGYQPPRVTVHVTMRADLLALHSQLQHDYDVAAKDDQIEVRHPQAPRILDQIAEVEEQIAASTRPFTFEGLPSNDYRRLITRKENRPRAQDRDDRLDFNPENFPVALVAASAVQPKISPADARKLYDTLSDSQFGKLWQGAVAVNIGADDAPKSVRRSSAEDPNGTSSNSAASGESLAASSSDES